MSKRALIPLFLSIFIFLVALIIYIIKNDSNEYIMLEINHYEIAMNIQKIKIEVLDNEIEQYVREQKKQFFHSIDITPYNSVAIDINSEINTTNNIMSLVLTTEIKNNNYIRKNKKTIYYNLETNEIIDLESYLTSQEYLQIISNLSYHYVLAYLMNNNLIIDESIVKEATTNLENYKFTDSGLEMIFILKNDVDVETKITIPYAEINYILKEQYKKPSQEPYRRDLEQFKNKKLIAFTFDDGPDEYTTNILLNGLSKYNAKVTFFVLGNKVNSNSAVLKRAYEEGNQIGSHTYNHKNLLLLNQNHIELEINHTATVIREIIGIEPNVIRPPYGNINKTIKKYIDVPIIMWNIDPLDWKYKDKETVKNNIVSEAEDGDIVLLHDIYLTSVEGALLAMEELYNQGFAFVTIEEMAKLKGTEWEQGKNYYKFYSK